MTDVAKYTRLVFLGKNFLWILSAGIIALVIWIASNNNADNGGRMVFTNVPKSEILENIMQKPRYHGVDVHNRPYIIEADRAIQKDKDNVVLENIIADMTGDNNQWFVLKSGSGTINNTTRQIELMSGVEVFYEGGYQFRTDHAHIDVAKGTVTGDSPIEGQGVAGTIQSKNFSISERGNIINFNDSVRMLLYQNKGVLKDTPAKKSLRSNSNKNTAVNSLAAKKQKTSKTSANKKNVSSGKTKTSKNSKTTSSTKTTGKPKTKNDKNSKTTKNKINTQ